MKFELPRGELRWVSIFWLVVTSIGLVFSIIEGMWLFTFLALFMLVMTLGICTGCRGCAKTLMVMFAISAVVILIREVIIGGDYIRLLKVIANAYFAHALYVWVTEDS